MLLETEISEVLRLASVLGTARVRRFVATHKEALGVVNNETVENTSERLSKAQMELETYLRNLTND